MKDSRVLIVTDVDGTFVSRGRGPSPESVSAAGELVARGAALVLASGRPRGSLEALERLLPARVELIASNGNVVVDADGSTRVLGSFGSHVLNEALRLAATWDAHAVFHLVDGSNRATVCTPELVATLASYEEPQLVETTPEELHARRAEIVHIHLVRTSGWSGAPSRRPASVTGTRMLASEPEYLTLTPEPVDKGLAARDLIQRRHRPLGQLFVLGDGENDLSLFALADATSIAVGSTCAGLLERATYVAPGVADDGFAWAVRNVVIPMMEGAEQRV